MTTRAVIFDVDGVLVDSYDAHFRSWRDVLIEHGLDMTEDEFAQTFGRTSREIIARFWGDGVAPGRAREIDDRKEALYRQIVAEAFPVMDGAVELIDALAAAGFALAVGSSAPPENVVQTLDALARRDSFAAMVTGRDVTRGKPEPEIYLTAAARLGVQPREMLVLEDSEAGTRAAHAAGAHIISIPHEFSAAQDFSVAKAIARSLTDPVILGLLEEHPAQSL